MNYVMLIVWITTLKKTTKFRISIFMTNWRKLGSWVFNSFFFSWDFHHTGIGQSSLVSQLQNESKCKAFHTKMSSACSFIFMRISHFHKNGFALRLALKQRHNVTRKWPIHSALLENQHQTLWSREHFIPNFIHAREVSRGTNKFGSKKKSSCCYSPTITVFKGQINNTIRPKTVRSIRLIELVLERILHVL